MRYRVLRNLISRGTALAFGSALGYASIRCFRTALPAATISQAGPPAYLILAVAALVGLLAIAFVAFAILPTRLLYRVDAGPPDAWDEADPLYPFWGGW